MNRRDFTKSLAALGLAPALPALPATTAAATAAAPAYTPYMYGLGAHLARARGHCSVELLMQKLRLAPEAASAMQAHLIRSGVISAPGATGLAAATQPYMRGVVARSAAGTGLAKAARSLAKTLDEPENPAPPSDDA